MKLLACFPFSFSSTNQSPLRSKLPSGIRRSYWLWLLRTRRFCCIDSIGRGHGRFLLEGALHGLHCLLLDTSIFWKRKYELHQVAQQASNIEDLIEVIHASLSVMCKQWSDAMHTFHEKFDSLSKLIVDHALDSSPQEELLTLLGGAHTSLPVHQFLVNSLSKAGVKCISKVVCGARKELQHIVLDHLQPAAEMIGFRMGEQRGLSRCTRVFQFLYWLLKCIKLLMQEPSDQLLSYNSELVIFLKFLYDQDPIRTLLEPSELGCDIEIDMDTMQRVRELLHFGGFSDCEYLQHTLAKEFQQMESAHTLLFLYFFLVH
ncbi:hypothetical protein SLA2020_347780 [Shorea laevis]